MHGADQAPASREGPRRQGGGGAPGEGQVPAADLPNGEQHHHAPAPLQGRPPGHQGRLRPVRYSNDTPLSKNISPRSCVCNAEMSSAELFFFFPVADEDSDGTIGNDELRSCLGKLQVQMSDKEADDVHRYCDIDRRDGIQFQEFVVLLCLMYLLFGPDVTRRVRALSSFFLLLLRSSLSTACELKTLLSMARRSIDRLAVINGLINAMGGFRSPSSSRRSLTTSSTSSSTPSSSSTRTATAR